MHRTEQIEVKAQRPDSDRDPGEAIATDGFAGPLRIWPEDRALALSETALDIGTSPVGASGAPRPRDRHLDNTAMRALCLDPRVVGIAAAVLGDRIVLWRSKIRVKPPGGAELPWHRDGDFAHDNGLRALEFTTAPVPANCITLWFAIANCRTEHGGLRFVPGHRGVPRSAETGLHPLALDRIDHADAIDTPLDPGEAMVFDEFAVHGSAPNVSGVPRIGAVIRFTVPGTRLFPDGPGRDEQGKPLTGYRPVHIRVR